MSRPLVQVDEASAVVDANIEAIERERRLPDAVVAALRASGLNRAVIPAALGGTESPVSDVVDAVSRVAAIDGSAGWCAAIGAGSNVFAGYMPETGAKKVFADADQGSARCSPRPARSRTGSCAAAGRSPATACTAPGPASARSRTPPTGRRSRRRASCSCR